ncbi:2-dehydro-3-deoxygalactonokinase [Paracoccus sp. (in: a-proteobacteria)]|uniref:2-dehydro-3-deoxygalactonokinase n=1 Tax=Paracoccus sp. TaxID=267 RepID=UPI0026DF7A45|nr:2-dehydro-3-deoxygalactonokinase [Paracoccus sp. (in: a-proteobacteria)]MDO5648257.1 2-dehydro-3-deoxygalactonokinase [Paracoccus sp. (in: a-proteobacteria)]
MTTSVDWIAADWGTSNMRLWAMAGDQIIDMRASDRGMAGLAPADFPRVLAELTAGWPDVPVVACGMVGARQGWVEAPYTLAPCPALPALIAAPGDRVVRIACGVRQTAPAADVMRGEETQIAGFLAQNPGYDGVLCLPGTHTKWVHVSAGEICSFKTVMTGEIFALLATQSVLRHSMTADGMDAAAFEAAVADALSNPAQAMAGLFAIRAQSLTQDLPAPAARARLSGTLIGVELAAARPWWLGQQVTLIGADYVADLYAKALQLQGVQADRYDVARATLAGLAAAWAAYQKEAS